MLCSGRAPRRSAAVGVEQGAVAHLAVWGRAAYLVVPGGAALAIGARALTDHA